MIGQTISHYKILEKLGEGGMGVVYKAEDTKLKRTVALKFLPPELTQDKEAKARFIHEAQAASALDHPNICTIYEIDETGDKQLFMAMACYGGETLRERIARGPLPLDEALNITQQIGQGLAKAHEQGIVHRDIKPANIFVTDDDLIKILDFGIAKLAGQTRLTRTGTTVGTVAYMSPQQARSEDVDHRTDVWSLGVILYELVVGQLPFRGEHEQGMIYSILNDEPKPLTDFHEDVPKELEHVIKRALAKNPDDRYPSVGNMLAELQSCQKKVEADRATKGEDRGKETRRKKIRLYSSIAAFVVLLVVVGLVLMPEGDEGINSIAVLPLENLSGDPEQEYFADGMTDELISNIAKVSALRVISRTSVMQYKDTRKSMPEIAAELNVDAIVEGSVMRSGDRIRITAQLIHASKDQHLWAESYERDLSDVLSLQRELARVIADRINIELTPQEKTALASTRPINPRAHEAYLKGRYHWNKRTKEGLEKSVDFFERAIAHDPEYALAYAGLAEAYMMLGDWEYRPPKECFPLAKELVTKALEIDDDLAEAHSALAYITGFYEWKWGEAEPYFKRAIELNANYATAHQWYAEYLFSMGRFDEAIKEAQWAQELDPLSVIIHTIAGVAFYHATQYGRAVEQFEKALEINDDFDWALLIKAESLKGQGRYKEAFEGYLRALQTLGLSVEKMTQLRQIYNVSGIEGYYRWFIDEGFEELGAWDKLRHHVVIACAFLGEEDLAFEWLEKCFRSRSRNMAMLNVDPALANLHSDPRYADLLRRVNLEQ